MKTKSWTQISAKDRADPAMAAKIAEHKRAMEDAIRLAELRNQRGLTREAVAELTADSPDEVVEFTTAPPDRS